MKFSSYRSTKIEDGRLYFNSDQLSLLGWLKKANGKKGRWRRRPKEGKKYAEKIEETVPETIKRRPRPYLQSGSCTGSGPLPVEATQEEEIPAVDQTQCVDSGDCC